MNAPAENASTQLVTFGEALLRLSPPNLRRLEQTHSFDAYVGGSELNVAVAAARLGLSCAWISRLPQSALGRVVANRAREQGVDVSRVIWSADERDRLGLYFVEMGAAPRPTTILYDRRPSAFTRIAASAHHDPRAAGTASTDGADGTSGSIDWPRALDGATWFHVSGITAALGDGPLAALTEALAAASAAKITVSYDLNFRGKLWNGEQARRAQEPLMQYVHLLIASDESSHAVFDTDAAHLQERFAIPAIACTARDVTSVTTTILADGQTYCSPTHQVHVVDPIGSGDACVAGIIYGRLRHDSWDAAARYGAALAALKLTTPGDFSQATLGEVEQCIDGTPPRAVNR